jgi:hypothetical protein
MPVAHYFTSEVYSSIKQLFETFSFFQGNEKVKNLCGTNLHSLSFCIDLVRDDLDKEVSNFLEGRKVFINISPREKSKNLLEEALTDLHNVIEKNYSLFQSIYLRH